MDREQQIEGMVEHIDNYIERVDVNHWYSDELDEGLAKHLYTAGYRKQEWISVDEMFPKEAGKEYLVWDNIQATVKKLYFHRIPITIPVETYPYFREYFGNASDYKRYTHWMILPEPPKLDRKE